MELVILKERKRFYILIKHLFSKKKKQIVMLQPPHTCERDGSWQLFRYQNWVYPPFGTTMQKRIARKCNLNLTPPHQCVFSASPWFASSIFFGGYHLNSAFQAQIDI